MPKSTTEPDDGSTNDRADGKPASGSDLVVPVASIALAIYYFTTIIDSPWTARVTALFVGVTLIALSAFFIIRSVIRLQSGAAHFSLADLVEPASIMPQRLGLLALTVASLIAMPTLGFTLTSMLFLSVSTLLLTGGKAPVRIVVLAVSLSLLWFIVFVLIFRRHFPVGWLDGQIKAVVMPLLTSLGLG